MRGGWSTFVSLFTQSINIVELLQCTRHHICAFQYTTCSLRTDSKTWQATEGYWQLTCQSHHSMVRALWAQKGTANSLGNDFKGGLLSCESIILNSGSKFVWNLWLGSRAMILSLLWESFPRIMPNEGIQCLLGDTGKLPPCRMAP